VASEPRIPTTGVDFWPSCGYADLWRNDAGWLVPTDAWLRRLLARPELALVPEACAAETALHEALHESPGRPVAAAQLDAIADADARANYRIFVAFRDALLAAGSLEACYTALFRQGPIRIPPLFVDLLAQAILRNVLDDSADAFEVRAAELLFRPQRIATQDGQVLAGDREVLDLLNDTGGFGELGRLLAQAQAPLRSVTMEVLGPDNAARYWQADTRHNFLLDLRHELTQDLGHGLQLTLTRARSGLKALAGVLEKWVAHLLGLQVSIRPEERIDDPQWRWHVGLDAESTALLNDLYEGRPVEPARIGRLISLFRLEFADPAEMRADVAGRPVYLGLAMTADRGLRLKPQNLLLNLPLIRPS
jgi:hypothetical protein